MMMMIDRDAVLVRYHLLAGAEKIFFAKEGDAILKFTGKELKRGSSSFSLKSDRASSVILRAPFLCSHHKNDAIHNPFSQSCFIVHETCSS